MSDPIPFPPLDKAAALPEDEADATEVTTDIVPAGPITRRLPDEDVAGVIGSVLIAPFYLLPSETRAALRTAGREATLVGTSLAGTLLKGAAIALNVAAESLKDYTARHADPTLGVRPPRRRIDIEIE